MGVVIAVLSFYFEIGLHNKVLNLFVSIIENF